MTFWPQVNETQSQLFVGVAKPLPEGVSLSIQVIRPDGTRFEVSCAIGARDAFGTHSSVLSNQYAAYTFQPGDLPIPGPYKVNISSSPRLPGYFSETLFGVGEG